MTHNTAKPILYGVLASAILLGVYFAILSLVSGWGFAQDQFASFWYFIAALASGFGIQVGLYLYLRNLIHGGAGGGKILGVTGTTSTAAMISCCTHYLVNLVPLLGTTGIVALIGAFQVEFFWGGIVLNTLGIAYGVSRIIVLRRKLNIYAPINHG